MGTQVKNHELLVEGEPITIYTTGPMGFGWAKYEGKWVRAELSNVGGVVRFIPKRCRKATSLLTYYNPTILVAKGHRLPDISPNFGPSVQEGEVSVSKGRFSSCSPEWDKSLEKDTEGVQFALEIRPDRK